MPDTVLIQAVDVTRIYRTGDVESRALQGVTLEIAAGDFMTVVGPSGSGKTTFLNLVGALDRPSGGTLTVFGDDVARLNRRARADLRLHRLGFVFQAYNLVPVLTARENVEFVLELQGMGPERSTRASEILGQLGLANFADRRPNELSGGQQQRVAVARAVASRPQLVLADEPTANLDGENAETLIEMMRGLNRNEGITFVFSTHDSRVVRHADRVVRLVDGRVSEDRKQDAADAADSAQADVTDQQTSSASGQSVTSQ